MACIVAVVSHFDVSAFQEVRRNPAALRFLLQGLLDVVVLSYYDIAQSVVLI